MARRYTITPERASASRRVASVSRRGDPAAVEQARRALALVATEERIRSAVEDAPPLDPETVDRLRALIPAADEGAET